MDKQLQVACHQYDEALLKVASSLASPLQAKVIASSLSIHELRGITAHTNPPTDEDAMRVFMQASVGALKDPGGIPDIDIAADLILGAIETSQPIVLAGDYDCDGATSIVLSTLYLRDILGHPPELIYRVVPHRMKNGYGLSDSLVDEIEALGLNNPLVITMDCGSSDEDRIARLAAKGIQTIVTDHHAIPETGIPKSAAAVVSPAREDSQYGDPYIAGCMVVFLTMSRTKKAAERNAVPIPNAANPLEILTFASVGTLADCVSMGKSLNNRIVVKHGLIDIARGNRPCWRALLADREQGKPFLSEDIGFDLGPLINSAGRVSHPETAIRFLLAETDEEAKNYLDALRQENAARKEIQKAMVAEVMGALNDTVTADQYSVTHYLENGHSGVHGIVASRLVERFGVPVAIFSPSGKDDFKITGSMRSIDGINVRDALSWVHQRDPSLLIKFGGHAMAAGLTIDEPRIDDFRNLFEQAVRQQSKGAAPHPVVKSIEVDASTLGLGLADEIEQMEPFGRGFERPTLKVTASPTAIKLMGENNDHVSFSIDGGNRAVWFNFEDAHGHEFVDPGKPAALIGSVSKNYWNGRVSPQMIIKAAVPAPL